MVVLTLLVSPALAHDYVLEAGAAGAGGTPVFGVVAHDADRETRRERPETLTRLERVDASGASPIAPADGAWGLVPSAEEVTVVVYENSGAEVALPWSRFRDYVSSEGDHRRTAFVEGLPKTPQREHYRRSLKLLLGVSPDHDGWDRVAGLPLEIVPLDRPGSRRRMRVRLLADGVPVRGARVRAFPFAGHSDDDAVVAFTNDEGVARLKLPDRSLDWVYAAVAMTFEAAREQPWHSVWTTLRTR